MLAKQIISSIEQAESIAIMPHVSVDGDGLGSSLALALALKKNAKKVDVFLEEDVPFIYQFLPGVDTVKVYDKSISRYDVAIALDTGDLERLGKRSELFNSAGLTINIDHHPTNTEFGFYNFVQSNSAAVGEIVYELIKMLGLSVDRDIATCLYVAIITDTGGFRFSNTTATTHQIAADLIHYGVNIAEISQVVFETTSKDKVKLLGKAAESLEVVENGKVAIIIISDEMMKQSGAREEDCDGIVNIGRNIRGVEVAAMIRQKENGDVKVNLRAKSYVDVASIARLYSGGGHQKASGFTTKGDLEEVKKTLLKDIRELL